MTTTTTESRSGQAATLNGPSTFDSTATAPQLIRAVAADHLMERLPLLWADSTVDDADTGYRRQVHAVVSYLDREVNPQYVIDAMETCGKLNRLQAGNCLVEMYGWRNTDDNRDYWLDYEQRQLRVAVQNLTAGMVR